MSYFFLCLLPTKPIEDHDYISLNVYYEALKFISWFTDVFT